MERLVRAPTGTRKKEEAPKLPIADETQLFPTLKFISWKRRKPVKLAAIKDWNVHGTYRYWEMIYRNSQQTSRFLTNIQTERDKDLKNYEKMVNRASVLARKVNVEDRGRPQTRSRTQKKPRYQPNERTEVESWCLDLSRELPWIEEEDLLELQQDEEERVPVPGVVYEPQIPEEEQRPDLHILPPTPPPRKTAETKNDFDEEIFGNLEHDAVSEQWMRENFADLFARNTTENRSAVPPVQTSEARVDISSMIQIPPVSEEFPVPQSEVQPISAEIVPEPVVAPDLGPEMPATVSAAVPEASAPGPEMPAVVPEGPVVPEVPAEAPAPDPEVPPAPLPVPGPLPQIDLAVPPRRRRNPRRRHIIEPRNLPGLRVEPILHLEPNFELLRDLPLLIFNLPPEPELPPEQEMPPPPRPEPEAEPRSSIDQLLPGRLSQLQDTSKDVPAPALQQSALEEGQIPPPVAPPIEPTFRGGIAFGPQLDLIEPAPIPAASAVGGEPPSADTRPPVVREPLRRHGSIVQRQSDAEKRKQAEQETFELLGLFLVLQLKASKKKGGNLLKDEIMAGKNRIEAAKTFFLLMKLAAVKLLELIKDPETLQITGVKFF